MRRVALWGVRAVATGCLVYGVILLFQGDSNARIFGGWGAVALVFAFLPEDLETKRGARVMLFPWALGGVLSALIIALALSGHL